MRLKDFKQKYVNTVGWTQERLDKCDEYVSINPPPDTLVSYEEYMKWYRGLKEWMEKNGFV